MRLAEARGNIFFDTDGNFKRMFSIDVPPDPASRAVNGATPTGDRLKQVIGAPNSICITPGPNQVLFVGESTYPGRIFKLTLDGKVLGVIGRSGRNLGQFSGAHALACPSEHEIYAAETSNWRVQNSCSTERPHRSMTHPFLPTRDTATADRNGAFVHNADVKRVPREDSPKPGKAAEWQAIAARRVWPDIKQYR